MATRQNSSLQILLQRNKKCNNILWGLFVLFGVSVWKELYNDALMKRGTPDWGDVQANYLGCRDAWEGKQSKF